MVGALLFENTQRIDWEDFSEVITVYITAIFATFTYSIFHGVTFGLTIQVIMMTLTGKFNSQINDLYKSIESRIYHPPTRPREYAVIEDRSSDVTRQFQSYHEIS